MHWMKGKVWSDKEIWIIVCITHKPAYIAEDSDEEEAPRRKRQRAEKAAAGELDEEEVSFICCWR